jgi:hypothetical protein
LPKKLKKLFRELEDKYEDVMNLDQVHKLVINDLFDNWMNETSPVLEELNSLVNVNKDYIEKKVKSMKPDIVFPEIEEAFHCLKSFKSMKYDSEFQLFFQMHSEIQKLKLENQKLKSAVHVINPDLPNDLVFIESE